MAIMKGTTTKEFDTMWTLEIFNSYQKAYNYVIESIYGTKCNPKKEIEIASK